MGTADPLYNLTGCGTAAVDRQFLSLEKQVGKQVPPVFIWHTDMDKTVPVENTLLFAWALKKAGISLELHIFPEGRHGLALAAQETDKTADDGRGSYIASVLPDFGRSWRESGLNRFEAWKLFFGAFAYIGWRILNVKTFC